MRIAFDIKYRPEIESGKYKLITALGEPVEILTWDAKGDLGPIIGLVKLYADNERVDRWKENGPGLFIITDDQDLTPFEAALAQFITERSKIPLRLSPLRDWIQSAAKRLLAIAKEEIEHISPELKESEDEKIRKAIRTIILSEPDIYEKIGFSQSDCLAWLEKQGEQKPVDKVEPKFKVGDFITNGILVGKIDAIHERGYHAYFGDFYSDIHDVDTHWHKWSIQDAKDGDVLEFSDHGRLVVGIVSYINKSTGKVDVYCLLEDNNFKLGIYYALDTINPHPATKEQRDLLVQKMHEAGYEWDAEKKELKKIEQKPAEWSEEDRKMMRNIIDDIHCGTNFNPEVMHAANEREKWFKSICLRLQSRWKPSDEYIHWLIWVINRMPDTEKANEAETVLRDLLEQLNKLREE